MSRRLEDTSAVGNTPQINTHEGIIGAPEVQSKEATPPWMSTSGKAPTNPGVRDDLMLCEESIATAPRRAGQAVLSCARGGEFALYSGPIGV